MNIPLLENQGKFMGGDKVKDVRGGDTFRVTARFAIDSTDYITLQNVNTRQSITLVYYDILPYLTLVCNPIRYKEGKG